MEGIGGVPGWLGSKSAVMEEATPGCVVGNVGCDVGGCCELEECFFCVVDGGMEGGWLDTC